jgi:hypothetical protein
LRLTTDDIAILHAALAALLHGDEELWDDLTTDEIERATNLFARFEAKTHRGDVEEDDEESDEVMFGDDDTDDYH